MYVLISALIMALRIVVTGFRIRAMYNCSCMHMYVCNPVLTLWSCMKVYHSKGDDVSHALVGFLCALVCMYGTAYDYTYIMGVFETENTRV